MQKRRLARGFGSAPTVSPLPILILLLIAFAALLGLGFYVLSAQPVTILINGQPFNVKTHQTNVRAVLQESGVYLETADQVLPVLDSPIHSGLVIAVVKARPVLLEADGQTRRVLTHSPDPAQILAENGITLGPQDQLQTSGGTPPTSLRVIRAVSVTLKDGDQSQPLTTTAQTVGAALAEAKVSLYLADEVTPDPSSALTNQMTITVRRSAPIMIRVDGRTLVTRTHGTTVGAVLSEAGIALVGLDTSQPTVDQSITPGATIRVVRVTEVDEMQRTEIPFKRITQPDPNLDLDQMRVIQLGIPGEQAILVRVRREDGIEVSRSAPQSWSMQPPHDEIAAVGTRLVINTLDTPDGPIQYWRVIKMRVASYKPSSTGRAASDPLYGITASGQPLHKGIVAVDPNVVPLGSALYIPKYGRAIAGDTGGGVRGAVIDLGYGDDDYQEWSGTVDVYLLAPAPDPIPPLPAEPKS